MLLGSEFNYCSTFFYLYVHSLHNYSKLRLNVTLVFLQNILQNNFVTKSFHKKVNDTKLTRRIKTNPRANCFKIDFVSFPSLKSVKVLLQLLRSFLAPVILRAANAGFQLFDS